jgi:hypothetical protein
MNAFEHFQSQLGRVRAWSITPDEKAKPISKTQRMREYLRENGWANSHTLADEADVPEVGLVGALLKGDIAKGRVLRTGNGYAWNIEYERTQQQEELRRAIALLKRHGYQVKKGTPS